MKVGLGVRVGRWRRVIYCVTGVLGLVGVAAYLRTLPRWERASAAEIEAVVDPRLTIRYPVDAASTERSHRLYAIFAEVKGEIPSEIHFVPQPKFADGNPQAFIDANRKVLISIQTLLNGEDEATGGRINPDFDAFGTSTGFPFLVTDGSVKAADRRLILMEFEELAVQVLCGATSENDYVYASGFSTSTDEAVCECLNQGLLTMSDAVDLLGIMSKLDLVSSYQRTAAIQFRGVWLPILLDPTIISRSFAHMDQDRRVRLFPGSFYPIATAKTYSDLFRETMQILQGEISMSTAPLANAVRQAERDLPKDESDSRLYSERTDWPGRFQSFQYRSAMAKIPNSFGRILLGIFEFYARKTDLAKAKTSNDLVRCQLAGWIYERRHGRAPSSLEDLVKERLLKDVPHDIYGNGPLKYDPVRRVIWSVGEDGKDQGAVSAGRVFDVWMEPDFGVSFLGR